MRANTRTTRVAVLLLSIMTIAEVVLFDRTLFGGRDVVGARNDYEFVSSAVHGVLSGVPVFKSWQQRVLGPLAVVGLARLTGDVLAALRLFSALMVVAANALLFLLTERKGVSSALSLLSVAGLGLAHWATMYRLEFPWDGLNVLLFVTFGYWARQEGSLLGFSPALGLGLLNHEAVLYIPVWYWLLSLDPTKPAQARTKVREHSALMFGFLGAGILGIRNFLYVGRPDLPNQVFEPVTPVIGNPVHFEHNIRMLFFDNWGGGHPWVSVALLSALAGFGILVAKGRHARASVWSLLVIATIACFGYVNETRLYLPLLAFWFGYGPSARKASVH